jgi:hypothetical protein
MRFSSVCHSTFAAVLLLVVTAPGWASPITYLPDQRSVSAWFRLCGDYPDYPDCITDSDADAPAPGASVFDATAVAGAQSASQNSMLRGASMSGSGSVSAYGVGEMGMGSSSAMSLFLVRFQLAEASAFDLSASLESGVGAFLGYLDLRVADGGSVYYQQLWEGTPVIDESGVLSAGDYELEIIGTAWSGEYGNGAWQFDFTVVPEPHTALLLGLGLTAAALCRRSSQVGAPQLSRAVACPDTKPALVSRADG